MAKYQTTLLYVINTRKIQVIKAEEMTPAKFRELTDLETKLFVAVKKLKIEQGRYKFYGCDYSHMITDYANLITDTWKEFNDQLNDGLVMGYEREIPGYIAGSDQPRHCTVTWDVMGCLNTFNVDYADKNNGREGIYALRWTLHDLVISINHKATEKPNLENCLPVVNGLICRPVYRPNTKKLYAQYGAKLAWQKDYHRTPEVQLIDFSDIGDITPVSLRIPKGTVTYKDILSFCNKKNEPNFISDWRIVTSKSLYEYTPIIVLAGIPIFPDQYRIVSEHEIIFSPYIVPWNHAMNLQQYFGDSTYTEADNFFRTEDALTFIMNETDSERSDPSHNTFLIYIKQPKIYMNRIKADVWDNNIIMNVTSKEGLLIHNTTGRIIVYHREEMTDRIELVIQNMSGYLVTDHHFTDTQYGAIPGDNYTVANMKNIMKGNCTMVHLMR